MELIPFTTTLPPVATPTAAFWNKVTPPFFRPLRLAIVQNTAFGHQSRITMLAAFATGQLYNPVNHSCRYFTMTRLHIQQDYFRTCSPSHGTLKAPAAPCRSELTFYSCSSLRVRTIGTGIPNTFIEPRSVFSWYSS